MEVIQESVADPSNIIHSFKKRPILHICDDACTLSAYEIAHYPEESLRCLGDRRGCFEIPSDSRKPMSNVDCKDLEPIEAEVDISKFESVDPLDHPDSDNMNRYILGTRLQMKSQSKHRSHKRKSCQFHDLDLANQGRQIKSMVQESLQNVRRFRSIQQDKLRNASDLILNELSVCLNNR